MLRRWAATAGFALLAALGVATDSLAQPKWPDGLSAFYRSRLADYQKYLQLARKGARTARNAKPADISFA